MKYKFKDILKLIAILLSIFLLMFICCKDNERRNLELYHVKIEEKAKMQGKIDALEHILDKDNNKISNLEREIDSLKNKLKEQNKELKNKQDYINYLYSELR